MSVCYFHATRSEQPHLAPPPQKTKARAYLLHTVSVSLEVREKTATLATEQYSDVGDNFLSALALIDSEPLAPLMRTNDGADSTIRTSSRLLADGKR